MKESWSQLKKESVRILNEKKSILAAQLSHNKIRDAKKVEQSETSQTCGLYGGVVGKRYKYCTVTQQP